MNVAAILKQRERVLDAVRGFLKAQGFTEVETPVLVPSPGLEPHLDAFEARASTSSARPELVEGRSTRGKGTFFLPTSPEYAMKKLLAAGSGSIFQIAKAFRDEPPSERHVPEFTMLEWYRVGADYRVVMEDCERLCAFVAESVCGSASVPWQGGRVELEPPYERITVREAFRRWAGAELTFAESRDELAAKARSAGCSDIADDDDWDDVFFKMFLRHVEPQLGAGSGTGILPVSGCGTGVSPVSDHGQDARATNRPMFLCDYPAGMAALSRIKRDDPLVCERFELYAGGLELANAFSELTDAAEQRRRFEADNAKRRKLGKPELPIDEELLAAMERGLPACSGIALGLDRLIMLLTDTPDIRDVVPFAGGIGFDTQGRGG